MASLTPSIQTSSFSFLSPISGLKHDVFLSFRGEDTRNNITQLLHTALSEAGIPTFRDDIGMEKGKDIASELLKAIQMSRVSIIVFSRDYASSSWCLDELVKILECKREAGQIVVPIFHDVDPSSVREHKEGFGQDFSTFNEHFRSETMTDFSKNKVERWRTALTEAASLSGWDLQNVTSWRQSKFVKEIVKEILSRQQDAHMSVSIFPPGIGAGIEYLNLLLSVCSNDVLIVGICGMGKLGKTTIARAVYNRNFQNFQSGCFLANIRLVSRQPNGLVCLQEQLLSDILIERNIKVGNVQKGIDVIKSRLCDKKVLVVLDDVNELDQLNALARKRAWFGPGSRIIITTSDAQLLNVLQVDDIYGAQGIEVIQKQYAQNLCTIEELKEFILNSHVQAHERVRYLEDAIENERRKNTIQAQIIAKLQESKDQYYTSDALATTSYATDLWSEDGQSSGAKLKTQTEVETTKRTSSATDEEVQCME